MIVATAAYPLDWLESWAQYEDKLAHWVDDAVEHGAQLLVFPEYGAMELSTLEGIDVARDLERSIHAVSDRVEETIELHRRLAQEQNVYILGSSAPVLDGSGRPVNRAILYAPDGVHEHQDKQIMTRFERETWNIAAGGPLKLFDTALGKIGILICYDSEFPLLGRALQDADLILVPSCTEALSGYWRVRIGAMSRALENQCVSVMSSLVGEYAWSESVDVNTGMGGVFGPPDVGFPSNGVLAEGTMNQPGWTYAEVDLTAISTVRADGRVLNRAHWIEQQPRVDSVTICAL
ncbi:carbon-nitrogen hydrolase family protein [Ruegeria arenilitoris]|uniref:carbon-nitrogen hydrolase family protein n=1 Tax=Ruegeria arenilitoris TaxID=1173585 RepID=UPI00147DE254|nr:carbon-nitrogen hydrolase family protein [Ruegeria arenilitoris]